MEIIQLKFLLKLLSHENYRASISKLQPNSKTKASERDKICRQLIELELVDCSEEIAKIKIASPGKALLKLNKIQDKITDEEIKILKACQKEAITPSQTKVTPAKTRQQLIEQLLTRGFITAEIKLKEVWLTARGQKYLATEYDPRGGGNLTLSKNMLADYLRFLREHLSADKEETIQSKATSKPSDEEILQTIINLDREHNTDNYLPIFHLRNQLQPPLLRNELDEALYRLEKGDLIELGTLAEVKFYSQQEISAGISQPVGGELFYITVT